MVYGTIRNQLARFGFSSRQDLVEDAYQEVFLTLSRTGALARLTEPRALPGYLSAIAVSKAVDAARTVSRAGGYQEWSAPETAEARAAGAADLMCPQPNPRDEAERRHVRDLIDRELGDLPGREQLVVRLKWQHDMTLEGIAKHLEIPVGTAATVLRRTRDRIRERLRDKGIEA